MMRSSKLAGFAALLLSTVPLPLLAQPAGPLGQLPPPVPAATQPFAPAATPAPAPAGTQPLAAPQMQSQVQAAVEQRITGLQTQLTITQAQAPQWNAFAQVMRENAGTTDALFRQRAAGVQSMNAVDNMQSYAQIMRAYGDGTDKLATAFSALYGVLSDQQKQAADTLFRQQATQSAQAQVAKPK
jgi:protein CpxP